VAAMATMMTDATMMADAATVMAATAASMACG
jgi:hypothetical protein